MHCCLEYVQSNFGHRARVLHQRELNFVLSKQVVGIYTWGELSSGVGETMYLKLTILNNMAASMQIATPFQEGLCCHKREKRALLYLFSHVHHKLCDIIVISR